MFKLDEYSKYESFDKGRDHHTIFCGFFRAHIYMCDLLFVICD